MCCAPPSPWGATATPSPPSRGASAEGYYGVDEGWKQEAFSRLPQDLAQILRRFDLAWGAIPERELDPVHEAILFAERTPPGGKMK